MACHGRLRIDTQSGMTLRHLSSTLRHLERKQRGGRGPGDGTNSRATLHWHRLPSWQQPGSRPMSRRGLECGRRPSVWPVPGRLVAEPRSREMTCPRCGSQWWRWGLCC